MNFTEIASQENTRLSELLKKTLLQIVGTTTHELKTMGFLDALPLRPSESFIRLINSTTVQQLEASHPCIKNSPVLWGKNYSYPVLNFLFAALKLDTQNHTVRVINMLPTGGQSIATFFSTSDVGLKARRYLTDIYPKLKSSMLQIMNDTFKSYYYSNPVEKLSLLDYQFLYSQLGHQFNQSRLRYAEAVVENEAPLLNSYENEVSKLRHVVLFQKWVILYDAMLRPLNNLSKQCAGAHTNQSDIHNTLCFCIGVPARFSIRHMYSISNPTLFNGIAIGGITGFLGIDQSQLGNYSIHRLLTMSANSEANAGLPLVVAANRLGKKLQELGRHNLKRVGREIQIVPYPKYLSDPDTKSMLTNTTLIDLPQSLAAKLKKTVPLNWVYTAPYAYLLDTLINPHADIGKMYKGLKYLFMNTELNTIIKMFAMSTSIKKSNTLATFAIAISGISHTEFLQEFNYKGEPQRKILDTAYLMDIDALLAFNGVVNTKLPPDSLAKWLFTLPPLSRKLLTTLEDIAKQTGKSFEATTLYDVPEFRNSNALVPLFAHINVQKSSFDNMQKKTFSELSGMLHTPIPRLRKFSVMTVLRSLCAPGERFDGHRCIKFTDCRSVSVQLCHANAKCVDTDRQQYICRCNAGYTGDGHKCTSKSITFASFYGRINNVYREGI
eukprot:gene17312-19045_t